VRTRTLASAAAGIAVLGALAVALLWRLTEAAPAAPAAAPAIALAPAAPDPAVAAATEPVPAAAPPAPLAPAPAKPAFSPRPARQLPQVPSRPEIGRAVEHAPTDLFAGLKASSAEVSACAGAPRPGAPRTSMVSLAVETLEGRVRITGASLPRQAPGGDALLRCVREQLVGREFQVAGAAPGRRYQLPYPFQS
jgi:hypothetical protein